jgi:hypothetical protein
MATLVIRSSSVSWAAISRIASRSEERPPVVTLRSWTKTAMSPETDTRCWRRGFLFRVGVSEAAVLDLGAIGEVVPDPQDKSGGTLFLDARACKRFGCLRGCARTECIPRLIITPVGLSLPVPDETRTPILVREYPQNAPIGVNMPCLSTQYRNVIPREPRSSFDGYRFSPRRLFACRQKGAPAQIFAKGHGVFVHGSD